ncbi:hypothetical protein TRVA0_050S00804 [Trichomonascus vanleenenianus]|uniref:uncharacterized protein n=1 Tax=Trichomonascus vanleenenianus TaxID=2268995 RepID=UPI003EC98880
MAMPFRDCLTAIPSSEPYFRPSSVVLDYVDLSPLTKNTLRFTVSGDVIGGEIPDLNAQTNKYTTLRTQSLLLQYSQYSEFQRFCEFAEQCPFGAGNGTGTFTFAYNLTDAYQAVSIDTEFVIIDSSASAHVIGCVAVEATPILAHYVWYLLLFSTLAVFIFLAVTYVIASIANPWCGTTNVYYLSSNFVHDENALRLITPGIIEYVRYLQFAFLLACLNLEQPGFLRAVVSSVAWSCLLFGTNFVDPSAAPKDSSNLYDMMGRFGLSRMARIVGLNGDGEVWPAFIVWLLVFSAALGAACAALFAARYLWRRIVRGVRGGGDTDRQRGRPGHFLVGMAVRVFLMLFAVPLVAFSLFQLLIISRGRHVSNVAAGFAAVVLVVWLAITVYVAYTVWTMDPARNLCDDMPTMLKYGPLYNTYNQTKSRVFSIDLVINLMRAITFGALQDSGLAQLTLLATAELACLVAIICLRPYDAATNMNLVSAGLSMVRFVLVFLCIPFVSSLNVSTAVQGWLGYVILIVHALVIIAFIVHIAQVLFELFARAFVVGSRAGDNEAGVYSMQALKKRSEGDRSSGAMTPDGASSMLLLRRESYKPEQQQQQQQQQQQRDSLASPISEVSPPPTATSNTGFYRQPRRRLSSYDWAYPHVARTTTNDVNEPNYDNTNASEPNTTTTTNNNTNNDTESDFTFVRPTTATPRRVDYAVREADVYFSKHYADDEYEPYDMARAQQDRSSMNPLLSPVGSPSRERPPVGPSRPNWMGGVNRLLKRVGDTFKTAGPPPPKEKGFEVVRRRPIRYNPPGLEAPAPTSAREYHPRRPPQEDLDFSARDRERQPLRIITSPEALQSRSTDTDQYLSAHS